MTKSKTVTATKTATPTKKISKKKAKDPNAPKRFRTAYILFSVEKRDEIKNENPTLSAKEILAELGAQWKAADAPTKQRFQKLSDGEKVEYEEKLAAYKSEKGEPESASKENRKKKKPAKQQAEITDSGHDNSMED
uniref:Phosphonoacetaldehyde hydrolase n=1 Tax=Adineta vaga complex sp. C JFF-2016 TaxID=1813166 RepID=A0A142CCS0_9BILA|nr:phosphonoacetaldehyde hydrolase [Adineta vaga complex sp. C JFF-2016]AMP82823.1 phosphonoacetaldehyde hydrolase [Adineta vaga complex sp. C JFF-2016]AMP82824.1 phosphonoacetaldehyde hydrolase [Adineta vaga complex sp. C JFF-2016]AMP82825.1 phosphonoacetaldehyde hydrolase [Adineta vaga complex sp. C JFF-2016]AMP82826.1 phosphonoacetaldehyde hydrolase [Adineta vaga complex sp. C JFF-2016]